MSAWVKCTNMSNEMLYLNIAAALTITPLATGLTRITFQQAPKEFVDVKESPADLLTEANWVHR